MSAQFEIEPRSEMMKFKSAVCVASVLTILSVYVDAFKFPANWKKCPKTDNDECLKTSIQQALLELKDGNKGLSVLPLDPLHFERMEISQGGGPVSINLTFYNVDLFGHRKVQVKSAKIDWENYKIAVTFGLDGNSEVLGDYTIDGKVLVLPISGKGKSNITLDDLMVDLTLTGKELTRGNKKYFEVTEALYKISPSRVHVWLGNLFNGVPNLGENMNKFLNDNWKVILEELSDTISLAMGQAVKQIANSFFHNIPVDQLFES